MATFRASVQRVREAVVLSLSGPVEESALDQAGEMLLAGLVGRSETCAIVDLSSVPWIDAEAAHAVRRLAEAARLLGAHVVVAGIRPGAAGALARLGFDAASLVTAVDLDAALSIQGSGRRHG